MKTKTKNVVSREDAMKMAPDYVAFAEGNSVFCDSEFDKVEEKFLKLRVGQKVITRHDDEYVIVKVSSVNRNDPRAIDGPIVRVSDGEFSWRVDGCDYAYPV